MGFFDRLSGKQSKPAQPSPSDGTYSSIICSICGKENYGRKEYIEKLTECGYCRGPLFGDATPGYVDGKHFTKHVDTVKALKREGRLEEAEELLLRLAAATEAENQVNGFGVAPWYYEQLAIVYRKQENYSKEVAILERYVYEQRNTANLPSVHEALLERLEKARALAAKKGE